MSSKVVHFDIGAFLLPLPNQREVKNPQWTCSCKADPYQTLKDWKIHVAKYHRIEGLKFSGYVCQEETQGKVLVNEQSYKKHLEMHFIKCNASISPKVWKWNGELWEACNNNEPESDIEIFEKAAKTISINLNPVSVQKPTSLTPYPVKIDLKSSWTCSCKATPYKVRTAWVNHIATVHPVEGLTVDVYICKLDNNKFFSNQAFSGHVKQYHSNRPVEVLLSKPLKFHNGEWVDAALNDLLSSTEFLCNAGKNPKRPK